MQIQAGTPNTLLVKGLSAEPALDTVPALQVAHDALPADTPKSGQDYCQGTSIKSVYKGRND